MWSSKALFAAGLAMAAALAAPCAAEELGAIGPVYPIAEENAVEMILARLREKERTGDLKRMQQEAVKRSVNSAKNPKPVQGLGLATTRAQRLLDPTVTYDHEIRTDEGRIVVPAGSRINPLLVTSLTKRLVFFDGRDSAQAEAVRKMVAKDGPKVKPILVAGSWFDTSKAWRTQVYFDQQGKLSQRFGVRAVPTVISQQGAFLLVEEVPAKELR